MKSENKIVEVKNDSMTAGDDADLRQLADSMKQAFVNTVEFYKSAQGGAKTHDEAVEHAFEIHEWRRGYIDDLEPQKVSWGHLAAVGEISFDDSCKLWSRVKQAANDELSSGRRTAEVVGAKKEPYELAQYLAIRHSFFEQWQPKGGIELALIDMLAMTFSLHLYWSTVAHQRALNIHNDQRKELNRYENKGWKSPYQYEAGAIDQAYKLADGYNRQFLRVLRQLRDLRRYAPVVIQNNGGQVNIGEQQVNLQKNE